MRRHHARPHDLLQQDLARQTFRNEKGRAQGRARNLRGEDARHRISLLRQHAMHDRFALNLARILQRHETAHHQGPVETGRRACETKRIDDRLTARAETTRRLGKAQIARAGHLAQHRDQSVGRDVGKA